MNGSRNKKSPAADAAEQGGKYTTHKWALERAREWDMEDEYWSAIRDGCTPLEALEEWDLL